MSESNDPRMSLIIEALRGVHDPEIPTNIYDLGLIYKVEFTGEDNVHIEMTLTSPACPVAGTLPGEVARVVEAVEGVQGCQVELVWDPPWSPSVMTDEIKLELGLL